MEFHFQVFVGTLLLLKKHIGFVFICGMKIALKPFSRSLVLYQLLTVKPVTVLDTYVCIVIFVFKNK